MNDPLADGKVGDSRSRFNTRVLIAATPLVDRSGESGADAAAAPLVVRFGAFGDMVLLTPLLHQLHLRYGRPCRVLGSGPWLAPLFAGHPDVLEILALRSRRRPYWLDRSQQKLVGRLRALPRGPVYVCDDYALDKIRWLLRRAGIAADDCVYANPDCLLGHGEHWIERWLRFAAMTPRAFEKIRI
ncbi:MAG: hypothetical protein JSS21_01160 [Proteobacteria bacterium]|nr:hypothetical protein [Pseudomonadota bacterium]